MKTHMKTLLAAITATTALAGVSADAATLTGSSLNDAAVGLDLDATYDDWARWDSRTSETATSSDAAGAIIGETFTGLGGIVPGGTFSAIHTFAQGTGANSYSRIDTGASMTASFALTADTDYSIDIYTRLVNFDDGIRSDLRFTATLGPDSDVLVLDNIAFTLDSGAVIYTLDVSDVASAGTLTIKIDGINGTGSSNTSVRTAAIGVDATPVPEPGSLALLGLGGLLIARRRRG